MTQEPHRHTSRNRRITECGRDSCLFCLVLRTRNRNMTCRLLLTTATTTKNVIPCLLTCTCSARHLLLAVIMSPPAQSDLLSYFRDSPEVQNQRSHKLLERARRERAKESQRPYSTARVHEIFNNALKNNPNISVVPYDYQRECSEAVALGLDVFLQAPTGGGKTLVFALPLFLEQNKKKTAIIISPLNELEQDQVRHSFK